MLKACADDAGCDCVLGGSCPNNLSDVAGAFVLLKFQVALLHEAARWFNFLSQSFLS